MDSIYEDVKKRFSKNPNVTLNKGKSEEVLREFPDDYFDWVYIVGNHYYEFVLQDLEICYAEVRAGGFIAGDDYTLGERKNFPCGRPFKTL